MGGPTSIVGVAIAASLLPPVVNAGIALVYGFAGGSPVGRVCVWGGGGMGFRRESGSPMHACMHAWMVQERTLCPCEALLRWLDNWPSQPALRMRM
eukprot:70720-Chlamydomonas_euryale.AAC.1